MIRTIPFSIGEFLDLSAPRVRTLRGFAQPWHYAYCVDSLFLMGQEWMALGGPSGLYESQRALMDGIWGHGTFAAAMASLDEPKREPEIIAPASLPVMADLTVVAA